MRPVVSSSSSSSSSSGSSSGSSSSSRNEYDLGGTIALLLQDHRTVSTKSVCNSRYVVNLTIKVIHSDCCCAIGLRVQRHVFCEK